MRSLHNTRRSGFTLIELLVVIAIIAVLAAILFPVFAQVRRRARLTACINNNKQMGLAMLQYAQDYDETLPIQFSPPSGTAGGDTVLRNNYGFLQLQNYIKNAAVYDDPDCDQWNEVGGTAYTPNPSLANDFPVDYRMNLNADKDAANNTCTSYAAVGNCTKDASGNASYYSRTLAECTYPAMFFLISDRHTQHHSDGGVNLASDRYRYQMPMVFADGHVKPVRIYTLQDTQGNYKPYHWAFPKCHAKDLLVQSEYNGGI